MFDFSMIDKAKNIFSGDGGSALNRIGSAVELGQQVGGTGGGGAQPPEQQGPQNPMEAVKGLTETPAAQGLKKAAGAIAAFYTGGLSSLAMNVGSSAIGGNSSTRGG